MQMKVGFEHSAQSGLGRDQLEWLSLSRGVCNSFLDVNVYKILFLIGSVHAFEFEEDALIPGTLPRQRHACLFAPKIPAPALLLSLTCK